MKELSRDAEYKILGVETVRLINECTGSEIEIEEGKEVVNMCEGFAGYGRMCAAEMLIANVTSLMETLDTNLEGACKALKISVQQYEEAQKELE